MDLKAKRVAVLGLGTSGLEAAKLLQDHGAEVTVRDNGMNTTLETRAVTLRGRGIAVGAIALTGCGNKADSSSVGEDNR